MPAQTGRRVPPIPDESQVASSNSTLNALFGARMPSWAINSQPVKPTPRPNTPRKNQAPPSLPHQAPHQAPQPMPSSILPSPAPSDEPSPAVSTSVSSPKPIPPPLSEGQRATVTSNSVPLPVSEARFAHTQPIDTALSSTANPRRVSGGAQGTTPAAPDVSVQTSAASQIANFNLRPSNQPLPRTTSPMNAPPLPSAAAAASSAEPFPGARALSSHWNTSQSPALESGPSVGNGPPAKRRRTEQDGADKVRFSQCLETIESYISSRGGVSGFSNEVEWPRLSLLRDACKTQDGFFVALHQVFCLWSLDRNAAYRVLRRPPSLLDGGFSVLEQILKRNQLLGPPTSSWFSTFPAKLPDLADGDPDYADSLRAVGRFLENVTNQFSQLTADAVLRGYPYLVDELLTRLGCYSRILQSVLFTASRRQLGVPDGPDAANMERAFHDDQNSHLTRGGGGGFEQPPTMNSSQLESRNSVLINYYKQLVMYARLLPASSSSVGQTSVSSPSPQSPPIFQSSAVAAQQQQKKQSAFYPAASNTTSSTVPSNGAPHQRHGSMQTTAGLTPLTMPAAGTGVALQQGTPLPLNSPGGTVSPNAQTAHQNHPGQQTSPHPNFPSHQLPQQPQNGGMNTAPHLQTRHQWQQQQIQWQQQQQLQQQQQQQQQQQLLLLRQSQHPQVQHLHTQHMQQAQQQAHQQVQMLLQQQQEHQRRMQSAHSTQVPPNQMARTPSVAGVPPLQQFRTVSYGQMSPPQAQSSISLPGSVASPVTAASSGYAFVSPIANIPFNQQIGQQLPRRPQVNMPANLQGPQPRQMSVGIHDRFFPPKGIHIPRHEWPSDHQDKKSIMVSLHQAEARSPRRVVRTTDKSGTAERYYQAVKSLPLPPAPIPAVERLYKLDFNVTVEQFALLSAGKRNPNGSRLPVAEHFDGSLRWRLRCCSFSRPFKSVSEPEWVPMDVAWPPHLAVTLNNQVISIRRHSHNGKDLPAELSPFIVPGRNELRIGVGSSKSSAGSHFAVAVELVETLSHSSVMSYVQEHGFIGEETTLGVIKSRLTGRDDDDDDGISLVMKDLSIDLADPFSSVIFNIPARGLACTHMECFDLETWLNTRPAKPTPKCSHGGAPCGCAKQSEPSNPDKWRCPICFKDARPYSLRIDGFLVKVRQKLEMEGKLRAKSMLVAADGTWNAIVEDDTGENTDDDEPRPRPVDEKVKGGSVSAPLIPRNSAVEVIDLLDDD